MTITAKTRRFVARRSGGQCEAAVDGICTRRPTMIHHVARRWHGNDDEANLVHCCAECHADIHANPAKAERLGLLVRSGAVEFSPSTDDQETRGMKIDPETVSLANAQLVSTDGGWTIAVVVPRSAMSYEEALVHAAWIVALADPLGESFPRILERVSNT